jgi:hypothetical protein
MSTIVTRSGKGSPLTHTEVDNNFTNLNTDKIESSVSNTFTANQIVSVTDNSNAALRITQLGTGNALLVEDSSNPDSTPVVIDSSGRFVVGTTSAVTAGGSFVPLIQSQAASQNGGFFGAAWLNNTGGSNLILGKSRGALGTQTVVQSGDTVGNLRFQGSDGTGFIELAQIVAQVDGTPGTNDMPGRLVFSTTADGASSPTERMRIDSSGQVGIGQTPTAGATLSLGKNITGATTSFGVRSFQTIQSDVTSNARLFQATGNTAAAAFTLTNLVNYYASGGSFGAGSAVTNQFGFLADSSLTGATNNYGFYSNIASGTGRFNFYANGTADNYFAGNVGIGTSSPNKSSSSTALTVNTGTAANYSAVEWASGNTLNYHINANDSAIYHVAAGTRPWIVYTNGSERMRIDSSGNVGIGTSSPSAKLSVVGSISTNRANAGAVTSGSSLELQIDGTIYAAIRQPSAENLAFYSGSGGTTERMRIDSSGYLFVNRTSNTGTASQVALSYNANAGTRGIGIQATVQQDGTAIQFLNNSGTVCGTIAQSTSSVAYNTSSDYRLKENIAPMTGALATVQALKPVTYNWKVDGSDGQGFIAHELAEVVPDCVTGAKDAVDSEGNPEYQGIDTSFLVATLTAAIQEQQAIINDLKARIETLESK